MFDISQARHPEIDASEWPFVFSLTTKQVWDTFTLLALLDDSQSHNVQLSIPHDGEQKDRFVVAMQDRNERLIVEGQEELPHACYGCMHVFVLPGGAIHHTEVVVTDGVTVGRPCCAVPRCKYPLVSNRHRFCAEHLHREAMCAVDGCGRPVCREEMVKGEKIFKTCHDPVHIRMEEAQSVQSSKGKAQRQKVAKLHDAMSALDKPSIIEDDALPVQDTHEWFEHNPVTGRVQFIQAQSTSTGVSELLDSSARSQPDCSAKQEAPKLKGVFCRQRTNNEQLFVRPCGIICGRGTMYHHEAVSNVLVSLSVL